MFDEYYEQFKEDPDFMNRYRYMNDNGDIGPILEYLRAQGMIPEENSNNMSNNNPLQQQLMLNMQNEDFEYPEGTDMYHELRDPSLYKQDSLSFDELLRELY